MSSITNDELAEVHARLATTSGGAWFISDLSRLLDEVERQREELQTQVDDEDHFDRKYVQGLINKNMKLRAENAELRKDKERLGWLGEQCQVVVYPHPKEDQESPIPVIYLDSGDIAGSIDEARGER